MDRKTTLCLFLVLFIISSCQHKGLGDNELPDFKNAKNLALIDSIDLESFGILDPGMIKFSDDFLIFHSGTGKQELHFLDLRDMRVMEKIVVGPGPNEVNTNFDLMLSINDNNINYLDNGKWDVYSFNLDSVRANPEIKQKWLYQIPKKKGISFLQTPLETERYVYFTGVYTSGEGWIYCYDKQTQEFRSYGDFPDYEGLDNAEYMTKSMIFALMAKATNGKRLALCHYGTLDFYDIMDDGSLKVFREHHYYLPDISIYPNGTFAYKAKSCKWGFNFFMESDEKYIYLLYSDKVIRDNREDNSEYLFVYDWDGNPVKQYALEKPLFDLAINGKTLYGLSREADPIVYVYSLEDLK